MKKQYLAGILLALSVVAAALGQVLPPNGSILSSNATATAAAFAVTDSSGTCTLSNIAGPVASESCGLTVNGVVTITGVTTFSAAGDAVIVTNNINAGGSITSDGGNTANVYTATGQGGIASQIGQFTCGNTAGQCEIRSNTADTVTTGAIAAMIFKTEQSLTSGDLGWGFVNSNDAGAMNLTAAGTMTTLADVIAGGASGMDVKAAQIGPLGNGAAWIMRGTATSGAGPSVRFDNTNSMDAGTMMRFCAGQNTLCSLDIETSGKHIYTNAEYVDSSGSPGAATNNSVTGRAAIASGASAVVITDSRVTASSIILVQPETSAVGADGLFVTAHSAGSFTVTSVGGVVTSGSVVNTTGNLTFSYIIFN